MDPDFREPFLNGMPFDITESTFDRIVRYASGCTDVQQPDVIAMVIQHSLENRKELSELLNTCNHTTQMRVPLTTINQLFSYLSQRQDSNLTKSLPLPQLYLHILFIILIFVVRNKIYLFILK